MSGTLQQSAYKVEDRIEEPEGAAVFWAEQTEIFTGLVEAISEALLLVGRPVQLVNQVFSLVPNTPWQTMPSGFLCITDVQGPASQVWKWDLRSMDYLLSGNASTDWENDVTSGQTIYRWFPLGLGGQFGIWPSVPHAQNVTITGLQSPVVSGWPYSGSQTIPLHDEFFQAIEKYAASYCRLKEGGAEFQQGVMLYQEFLSEMQRMTQIEDRRDPYIFGRSTGAAADRGQRPDQR
jgi:hypothetical protein